MKIQYVKIKDEKGKPSILKQRFLLFVVIATLSLLLLFINKYEIHFQFHEFLTHRNIDYTDTFNGKEYFIKTEGCKMPAFEPFSNSVKKFYQSVKPILCHTEKNPPLVESDETSIWIQEKYFSNYNITPVSNFSCCYVAFYRPPASENPLDDRSKFQENCIAFTDRQVITDEFIKVFCYKNYTEIYKDLFSFAIKKNTSSIKYNLTSRKYPSILILGIDAVSRLNFFRTMPKTLEVLKSLGAIDMKGYNKVGDNTYPNLMPVLAGKSEKEIESTCYGNNKNDTFDNCHFIWDNFKSKGYQTAFVEDASPIGLFNYRKNGFSETPTHFYWRTFNRQAISDIGHNIKMNCHLCLGPRLSVDVLLSYTNKLVSALANDPYFAFVWETSLTHDFLNLPIIADQFYTDFLIQLRDNGLLNSTILVVLSDHGIRWGKIRSTHQGQIEERLPFLFFVLPKSFQDSYSVAAYNMKKNSKRLTSPFDLYETFLDLSELHTLKNDNIRTRINQNPYMTKRGISLFLPIGGNRTCHSAAIDPHWCTCHQSRFIETNSTTASLVAAIVISHINTLLADYVQCAKLNLSRIINVSIGEPTYSKELKDVNHIVRDYTVILETIPGNAMFEATVRNSISGWNVTGTISRINLYGKQSSCVDDFHLKLYCYCHNFISHFKFF